jgi:hypothetical protein
MGKFMKKICIFFVLFSLASLNLFAADEEITYKGVGIGASIEEYKKKLPDHDCATGTGCHYFDDLDCYYKKPPQIETSAHVMGCIERNSFGGSGVKTASSLFIDKKMVSLRLTFGHASFYSLSESLNAKMGKPSSVNEFEVQNKNGATFMDSTTTWTTNNAVISLDKYCAKLDKTCITIEGIAYKEKSQAEALERKAKAAKDF